jgi:hypothetical protein
VTVNLVDDAVLLGAQATMVQLAPDGLSPAAVATTFHVSKVSLMEKLAILAGAVLIRVGPGELGGVPTKLPKSMKVLRTGTSSPQPREYLLVEESSSYCATRLLSISSAGGRLLRGPFATGVGVA